MAQPAAAALRVRTRPELRAEAKTLDGTASRVALAADAGDVDEPVGTTGELWLYGVVGGWWRGFDAESVAQALAKLDVDFLTVRIHSPGGYAPDGIAIGNLLRNHRAKVRTVVDGYAASAASVIAIAGDEIVMCPGSQLMIHDAMTGVYGPAAYIRTIADWIDGQSKNYAGVYAYKAGGTPESWRALMTVNEEMGTWYSAEEAVAAGLADKVGTVVAVGSPPVAPVDDLDDDDFLARAAHDLQVLEQCVPATIRAAWSGQPAPPKPGAPKPPTASAGGFTQPEGDAVVDLSDEQIASLREQVGFADNADADTIVKATIEALSERSEPEANTKIPQGMKLVSETVFDDVTAKAERGAKAAEQLLTMQTNAALDKYKDRFPATAEAREKWAADYRRDPTGTEAYLKASAVLVPTAEAGHGGDGDNKPVAVADDPNYKNWSF